jgi:hypothetical protein
MMFAIETGVQVLFVVDDLKMNSSIEYPIRIPYSEEETH